MVRQKGYYDRVTTRYENFQVVSNVEIIRFILRVLVIKKKSKTRFWLVSYRESLLLRQITKPLRNSSWEVLFWYGGLGCQNTFGVKCLSRLVKSLLLRHKYLSGFELGRFLFFHIPGSTTEIRQTM